MTPDGIIRVTAFCLLGMIAGASVRQPHADPVFTFTDEEIDLEALLDDITGAFVTDDEARALLAIPVIGPVLALRDSLGFLPDSGDTPVLPPLHELAAEQAGSAILRRNAAYGMALRTGIRHQPGDDAADGSRYYSRLRLTAGGRVTAALIGERDPGEHRTIDLASGSVTYATDGMRLTAGDYRPGFGQGLVFSRYGRSYVSGTDVVQREPVALANTSFEESAYLRGIHAELRQPRWFAQGWLSSRRRDATLDDDGYAVTIRETGYHFANGDRDNLREKLGGARFGVAPSQGVELAVAGVVTEYAPRLARGDAEADLHDPSGAVFRHLAISGSAERGMVGIYAEAATLSFDHDALIGGVDIDGGPVRVAVQARRYDAGYWAPRAGAFSSFGDVGNEEGMYAAVDAVLPGGFTGMAALDVARTLTRTYPSPMPVRRRRLQLAAGKRIGGDIIARLAVRSTTSGAGYDDRASAALQAEHRPSRGRIGWRAIAAHSAGSGDAGGYAEAAILFRGGLFDGEAGAGVFDIPSYAARYYRYERDVPGFGMSRPVWGRGGALLLLVKRGAFSARIVWRDSDLMALSREITIQYDTSFQGR